MKILESYKKIAKSMLVEHAWDRKFGEPLPTLEDVMKEASQDDDDYVSIGFGRFKEKDSVDDPTAPTFKKDDSGAFIPAKGADKGKQKEPSGDQEKSKLKKFDSSDFERDFGGDTGTDADFKGEPPEGAREPDDVDDDEEESPKEKRPGGRQAEEDYIKADMMMMKYAGKDVKKAEFWKKKKRQAANKMLGK